MNEHLELQIKLLEKERIELREENNFIKNLLEVERQQVKQLAEQLNLCGVSQQSELLIADFIEKYNKGLVGNERIHEDCLEDYLQGNL